MNHIELFKELNESMKKQESQFEKCLILNPVENIPSHESLMPCSSFLHGLYGSDSMRETAEKQNTKIQFSQRDSISADLNKIYNCWANLLKAEDLSMRLLSGLHAHIVIFMSLATPKDKILLLPEIAGGHMSTKKILERLGLEVIEFIIDEKNHCINIEATKSLIEKHQPDFIFVDRSEGLYYEDFSWLSEYKKGLKIFDASQYLTNIIAMDYKSPFSMGFDIILSTLHKNLPGPQRALVCTKKKTEQWRKLKKDMSIYVSNMHVYTIYSAGLLLKDIDKLHFLSKTMIENAKALEKELSETDVPVFIRDKSKVPTHHLWVQSDTKERAFDFYLNMERYGLLVNYRFLPYNLGYGIRLGTSAATFSGLKQSNMRQLAHYISLVYKNGYSQSLASQVDHFISTIKDAKFL